MPEIKWRNGAERAQALSELNAVALLRRAHQAWLRGDGDAHTLVAAEDAALAAARAIGCDYVDLALAVDEYLSPSQLYSDVRKAREQTA